jgi:hypothetical protein
MDSPKPDSETATNVGLDPGKGKALASIGLVLMALPFLGLLWAIYGMASVFWPAGPPDSEVLATSIHLSITAMLWGLVIGVPGVVFVLIAVLKQNNREHWFYRYAVVLSAGWCILFFPMGIMIGGYLLFVFKSRKNEFKNG